MIRLYAIAALALWGAATDADAGAWTLSRGEFWGKLTYFRHSTEEWYLGKGRFGTLGPGCATTSTAATNRPPLLSRDFTDSATA